MFQHVLHLALKQSFARHVQYLQDIKINLKDDRTKTNIFDHRIFFNEQKNIYFV